MEAINSNVMFYHGTTKDGYRFTMAGVVEGNNTMIIGTSVCGDYDLFSKAIGRNISVGRALIQRNVNDKGRKRIQIPSTAERVSAFFYETATQFSVLTKKQLLKEFGLRNNNEPF